MENVFEYGWKEVEWETLKEVIHWLFLCLVKRRFIALNNSGFLAFLSLTLSFFLFPSLSPSLPSPPPSFSCSLSPPLSLSPLTASVVLAVWS